MKKAPELSKCPKLAGSSWRPFGPAFCPSGIFDFVLRALRPLRPYDPRTDYNYNFLMIIIILSLHFLLWHISILLFLHCDQSLISNSLENQGKQGISLELLTTVRICRSPVRNAFPSTLLQLTSLSFAMHFSPATSNGTR